MPGETQAACTWALTQTLKIGDAEIQVTAENHIALVDTVRAYFNDHSVIYETFGYDDLKPFLPA